MAATKKIDLTGDDDLFNDLLSFKKPVEQKKIVPEIKPVVKKETKKSLVLRMGDELDSALKEYCKKNDMTVTAGIKKAIREMLERSSNSLG